MATLQVTDPGIHRVHGRNFAINKNQIPFCATCMDHALEHINCIMKVTGGLVGITQNASARERFFLTAPQLSRLHARDIMTCHWLSGQGRKRTLLN